MVKNLESRLERLEKTHGKPESRFSIVWGRPGEDPERVLERTVRDRDPADHVILFVPVRVSSKH
jgi:hypothetical protein